MTLSRFRPSRSLAAALVLLPALAVVTGCETNSMIREKAETAYYAGDTGQAIHHYGRAINQQPTDYLAHYRVGEIHMERNEPHRAQRAFEQAWSLRRGHPEWEPRILDQLAEAIYQQDRPERLQAFLEQTTDYPGTLRDQIRQAEYLVKIGDLDGARLAYRRAAYFAGEADPSPYLAVADFYEMLSDEPNAVRALRWAHYVAPEDEEIAERLRRYGIVPGPTVAEAPPKPELLR